MPTRPSIERSIEPIIMTNVKPSATTSGSAIWLRIFSRLPGPMNDVPQAKEKTITSRTRTMIGA